MCNEVLKADSQTDRQTDIQTDRQTDRQVDREKQQPMRITNSEVHRKAGR